MRQDSILGNCRLAKDVLSTCKKTEEEGREGVKKGKEKNGEALSYTNSLL